MVRLTQVYAPCGFYRMRSAHCAISGLLLLLCADMPQLEFGDKVVLPPVRT